jgi:hypothetical protein
MVSSSVALLLPMLHHCLPSKYTLFVSELIIVAIVAKWLTEVYKLYCVKTIITFLQGNK